MHPLSVLFVFLFVCIGCQNRAKSTGYTIGIDTSWYPLQAPGLENNLVAFSIELLAEIAKIEGLEIRVVRMNWNNLMWGLREHKYNAMLSTMRPYTFYLTEYSFSLPYLQTGPVIVLPMKTKSNKIEGKEIGVIRGSSAALILQTTPGILLEGYNSIPEMFAALESEQIEGVALELLAASHYLRDLYAGKFRIASAPLNDMGLRLVTLYENQPALISRFDHGLKQLKKQGIYDKLVMKWGLSPEGNQVAELDQKASLLIQALNLSFSNESGFYP